MESSASKGSTPAPWCVTCAITARKRRSFPHSIVILSELVAKAKASPGLIGRDLVRNVTCREPYDWNQGMWDLGEGYKETRDYGRSTKRQEQKGRFVSRPDFSVVAYDYGIKFNILRNLAEAAVK